MSKRNAMGEKCEGCDLEFVDARECEFCGLTDIEWTLEEFEKDWCEGKDYDSCKDSPCRFSSSSGCMHPLHPNNKEGV